MRLRRLAALACAALVAAPLSALADRPSTLQPWLAQRLAATTASEQLRVYVHAGTAGQAALAARASGLTLVERFVKVGVVVADGPAAAVRRVAQASGVSYVEGDLPAELMLDRVHRATRNTEAQATYEGRDRRRLGGSGVSVAVIDTGVDGTHPFFREPEAGSKVVVNLKTVCHNVAAALVPTAQSDACWAPVVTNDSDTSAAAGHGTHVAGIVAGSPVVTRRSVGGAERQLSGVAPGARLVALSVGTTASIYGGNTGLNWVVNHHRKPCGAASDTASCPPIRVVNNSYGPVGGSRFDPNSVTTKLQRALVKEGVVVVWAAGNDAGDGTGADVAGRYVGTNGPGNDPTPGVLMVGSYDDRRSGTRDGEPSDFSSRGIKGKQDTYPDLMAPGDRITSSCREWMPLCVGFDPHDGPGTIDKATFDTLSGTSMAAPYVAGAVAELLQLDPELTPGQVEAALEDGAHRFGSGYEADKTGDDSPTSFDKGHGLLDVLASARLVVEGLVAPQPPAPETPGVIPPPGPSSAPAPPPTPAKPAYKPYVTPYDVLSCRTGFTDRRGDADDLYTQPDRMTNRPTLDLLAGRWEYDGTHLTAVLVVDDVADASRTPASDDSFRWEVRPAGTAGFEIVVSVGAFGSTYLSPMSGAALTTVDATSEVVDRPGTGSDEIRVTITPDQYAQLALGRTKLVPGLELRTVDVRSDMRVAFVGLHADEATGGSCSYLVGAADRLVPGKPPKRPTPRPTRR